MSSLIFFIFMIWFIMRIVKNKQKATGQNDPKQTQGSNTPGSAATQRPAEQKNPLMKAQWHFKRPQPDQGQAAVHPVWATAPLALTAVHRLLLPQRRIWNGKRRRMPGIMRRKSARNRRVSIRKPADVWSACGIMSGTAFRRETGLSSATIAVQRI